MFQFFNQESSLPVLAMVVVLWSLPWKGIALWKASQKKDLYWFIALLVVNTVGILDILYIFVFSKMDWKKFGKK